MGIKDANIKIEPILSKKQIAYDEALKNMKYLAAELRLSQEGIDTEKISYDELKTAISLLDEMEFIQKDFNIEAQKLQQDVNEKLRLLQEDSNKKFVEVQNRYREMINSLKDGNAINTVSNGYEVQNVTISKEREEEIRKELALTLEQAKDIDKNIK